MGRWNFVKNAGKSLGIGSAEAAESPDPIALKKEIEGLELVAEDLNLEVAGDRVKIRGRAPSQEEKEKIVLAVGNVEGVSEVEEELETPEASVEPVLHTVMKGDTLWSIAKKTLGDGARYVEIFEANRPKLAFPTRSTPGRCCAFLSD